MTTMYAVTVSAARPAADGVVALTFEHPDGNSLPAWAPGAHIDLRLPSGVVRQYSLCGDPADRRSYRIGVFLEPQGRGGSREAHALAPGDQVSCSSPRNRFAFDPADSYVFVAGGIGITPLLPMIAQAERDAKPWKLLYGGRSRATMAFVPELAHYRDSVMLRPQDEFGLIDLTEMGSLDGGTLIYCCGPAPLLAAVERHCLKLGLRDRLRTERFIPGGGAVGDRRAFDVRLGSDGEAIHVDAGQTVLEALLAAGIDAMYSCREGCCGSCELRVVSGAVDHRDRILTEVERRAGAMLVCVSRAAGDELIFDLTSL